MREGASARGTVEVSAICANKFRHHLGLGVGLCLHRRGRSDDDLCAQRSPTRRHCGHTRRPVWRLSVHRLVSQAGVANLTATTRARLELHSSNLSRISRRSPFSLNRSLTTYAVSMTYESHRLLRKGESTNMSNAHIIRSLADMADGERRTPRLSVL